MATPKLPPRFLRRLNMAVAFPISSFLMLDKVSVVSGMKRKPMPTPLTTIGQKIVLKSAERLKWAMRWTEKAATVMPKARIAFGLIFVTNFPAISIVIMLAMPPGPSTNPARKEVYPISVWR